MARLLFLTLTLALFTLSLCADAELEYDTIKNGDCARTAKKGDEILMHYEGTLEDGSEFDSSYKRGQPFRFTLGEGMVIKGWDQGIAGMCTGEIRNLIIPPHLAYGDQGYPPVIPEKATLKFKVELVEFGDGTADVAEGEDEL